MSKFMIMDGFDRRRFLTCTMLALGSVGVAGAVSERVTAMNLPEWLRSVAGHCVWVRRPDGAGEGAWHIGVRDASAAMTALMTALPKGAKVLAGGQSLRISGKSFAGELILHIA